MVGLYLGLNSVCLTILAEKSENYTIPPEVPLKPAKIFGQNP